MPIKTSPWDAADYLTDDETIAEFLTDILESDDPSLIAKALGTVARARGGMTELARNTGISREALYRALSEDGNRELGTALKVMHALGIRLTVSLAPQQA